LVASLPCGNRSGSMYGSSMLNLNNDMVGQEKIEGDELLLTQVGPPGVVADPLCVASGAEGA
jgi:hypothetical protein